jgi:hypothetical protein
MKIWLRAIFLILAGCSLSLQGVLAQEKNKPQKRILMERGEKVTGARLALVRKVVESYQDCEVLIKGNELSGLRINGRLYQDFTLIIRDTKRTIIVVTADGVISFDY